MRQPRTALKPQSRVICEKIVDKAGRGTREVCKDLTFQTIKIDDFGKRYQFGTMFRYAGGQILCTPLEKAGRGTKRV